MSKVVFTVSSFVGNPVYNVCAFIITAFLSSDYRYKGFSKAKQNLASSVLILSPQNREYNLFSLIKSCLSFQLKKKII